jgi:hypothetical protein
MMEEEMTEAAAAAAVARTPILRTIVCSTQQQHANE